jgi:pyridoxal phosphate phosphatase PHOSPHO2
MSDKRIIKNLAVFDFDHTICEDNTDIVVRNLLEGEIPDDVKNLHKTAGWIAYMDSIFKILNKNGIKKDKIRSAIVNIPEVSGMKNCMKLLKDHNFTIIIISDSNSEFISTWNRFNSIEPYVDFVFTNPAKFNNNGLLELKPYHIQRDCKLSSVNLCKGQILNNFINDQFINFNTKYNFTVYAGDGKNDICPMLKLPKNSLACVREGFYAAREIEKFCTQSNHKLKAKLVKWKDATDLIDVIFENLNTKHI